MCSITRGPAICPSLVTWPTRITAAPERLGEADQRLRGAAHLGDGAGRRFDRVGPHGLDRIDDDEARRLAPSDRVAMMSSTEVSAASFDRRLGEAEPFGAQPHLRDRLFARDIDGAMARRARARPPPGSAASTCRCRDRRRPAAPSRARSRRRSPGRARPRRRRAAAPRCVSPASGSSANSRPLRGCASRRRRARGGALLGDRVPFAAGVALALPAAIGGAAVLADEGLSLTGHAHHV